MSVALVIFHVLELIWQASPRVRYWHCPEDSLKRGVVCLRSSIYLL